MKPIVRAYLVTVSMGVTSHQRLVLTEQASQACTLALEGVFAVERERWDEEDQASENPFWVSGVELIARSDSFDGTSGIIFA